MDNERRKQADRRRRDAGPPRGWDERRRSSERRLPEAVEGELSMEDFELYFGKAVRSVEQQAQAFDEAAEVFGRVPQRL